MKNTMILELQRMTPEEARDSRAKSFSGVKANAAILVYDGEHDRTDAIIAALGVTPEQLGVANNSNHATVGVSERMLDRAARRYFTGTVRSPVVKK